MKPFRRDTRGGVFLEVLLAVLLVSGLFSVSAPFLQHAWREMVLEREAEILLANIRYLRAVSRDTDRRSFPGIDEGGKVPSKPYLHLRDSYYRLEYGSPVLPDAAERTVLTHRCARGVSVSCVSRASNKIGFMANGSAAPATLRLSYDDGQREARYVVITIDGRCRVRGEKSDGS